MADLIQIDAKVNEISQRQINDSDILNDMSGLVDSLQQQVSALNTIVTSASTPAENIPYVINSGYNMIGYTGTNGIDIEDAFVQASGIPNIMDRIEIIKDELGVFYIGPMGFGTLGSLVNGRGYFLRNSGDAFSVTWA